MQRLRGGTGYEGAEWFPAFLATPVSLSIELASRVALSVRCAQVARIFADGRAEEQRDCFDIIGVRPRDASQLPARRLAGSRTGVQRRGDTRTGRSRRQRVRICFGDVVQSRGRVRCEALYSFTAARARLFPLVERVAASGRP